MFYAGANPTAAVFDKTARLVTVTRRHRLPINITQSRALVLKGPAQMTSVDATAQPHRPKTNKPRSPACPCHRNRINMGVIGKAGMRFIWSAVLWGMLGGLGVD